MLRREGLANYFKRWSFRNEAMTRPGNRCSEWFPYKSRARGYICFSSCLTLYLFGFAEDGVSKDFECAYPILGRYVYIHMVGGEGSLSLCEVMVFTTQGEER